MTPGRRAAALRPGRRGLIPRPLASLATAGVVCLALAVGIQTVAADDLKPGDAAPEFSLPGSDGKTHSLADHRGKRAVVLAWFPKAFTGG